MKYTSPLGGQPGDPYVDGNPATGTDGSVVPARAIEAPQREIVDVITASGLVPQDGDCTQLRQAIQKMIIGAQKAVVLDGATFDASVVAGEVVRWDSAAGKFDEAVADGTANNRAVGIADVANGKVYLYGECPLFAGLTPGARYYLHGSTPGLITTVAAVDAVFVGIAKSATTLWVDVDVLLGGGIQRFTTGQALPASNIGPIWHDDYNSLMTWQVFNANGATYTGYASVLIGNLLVDTQPTPRVGYIKSGIANLSRTTYAALRGWAMHNGLMVAAGTWAAGTIAVKDNADGTTFTAYDLRGEFLRLWSDGRSVDAGRLFGTWAAQSVESHDHLFNATSGSFNDRLGVNNSASGAGEAGATTLNARTYRTGGLETKPRSTALLASIKF